MEPDHKQEHTHEHAAVGKAAKGQISKDMTIGEFVEQYPHLVEVLLAEGVHCVGCGASYWESIEEGLAGHGKTDEEIADVIKRLNEANGEQQSDEITITEKSAEKLKEILKSNGKEGMGLRIRVLPGGCAGFKYSLELEAEPQATDKVYEVSGAKFFIDGPSMDLLKGARVDYIETLQDAGFKISNPNAKSSCGCGKSFA